MALTFLPVITGMTPSSVTTFASFPRQLFPALCCSHLPEKESQRSGAPRPASCLGVGGGGVQGHGGGGVQGGGQQELSVDGAGGLNWNGFSRVNGGDPEVARLKEEDLGGSSTLQWDGQGLGARGADLQGAARPDHQPLRRRYEGQPVGHSRGRVVVTKETAFGAAGHRGAVAVMDRQRRGRHIWGKGGSGLGRQEGRQAQTEGGGGGPPLRALPRPDLNSLMRGWMMGDRVTRGRGD